MRHKIIVLKFGSSVLRTANDLPDAVHEIYRWIRKQYRVVAVVSALSGETDRLLNSIAQYRNAQPDSVARIVATGEEIATALLALELDRFGIPAQVLDASQIQLIADTCGNDTEPVNVNVEQIQAVLKLGRVAVVPGFVARDRHGRVALFGRGGSDLSALFLAQALNAECRLIKDVDGIFDRDPASSSAARRFEEITFTDALSVGAKIVQPKGVVFAERRGIQFEVARVGASDGTRVGSRQSVFSSSRTESKPLKVGLLGLGTVGLGVFRELWKQSQQFDVSGIAVRRPKLHAEDAPEHLLTSDCWAVIDDVDVVVELIGGVDPAIELVQTALAAGKAVITANKLLLAENPHLGQSSRLHYSAAVGGAVPALEAVDALAREADIARISGVLNGTCNYVLDRIAAGCEFGQAVSEAQANGFAEENPQADLSGSDTVCKLHLLANRAFPRAGSVSVEAVGIKGIDPEWVRSTAHSGGRVRLVGTAIRNEDAVALKVSPREVCAEHPFAQIRNEENCLLIRTGQFSNEDSFPYLWTGRGAGRWPTTAAVMADLFDVYREHQQRATSVPCALAGIGGVA